MPSQGLTRLALLAAAVACALIGLHFVHSFTPAAGLVHEPALLVNDTDAPVRVVRCLPSCAAGEEGILVAPGASLRLGGAAEWAITSGTGQSLGCVDPAVASGRLPSARWGACQR